MRATQQKRRLLGNPHWTGTAQATSPLDKDAADQEVRGFRIPNGTGGLFAGQGRSTSRHQSRGNGIPILQGRAPRHRKAKIARGWQDLRTMHDSRGPWRDSRAVHDLRGLCSGDSLARFGGPCSGGPGKIRAPCVIRGVSAAKRAPPWQDMRAMHSRKAICGAFRIHGARILPKPARFGCTAAICCQGGALFPSGAPSGMHEAKKLPRQGVRERIGAISRHG